MLREGKCPVFFLLHSELDRWPDLVEKAKENFTHISRLGSPCHHCLDYITTHTHTHTHTITIFCTERAVFLAVAKVLELILSPQGIKNGLPSIADLLANS